MRLIKLLIPLFILSTVLNSCGAIVKNRASKKITVENGAIPENFGKNDEVLLCILKGRNNRDRYMRKHVTKNYKGKYEFVLLEDLSSEKYSNTNKYRYLLDYIASYVQSSGVGANGQFKTMNLPTSNYYIKDRKSGKSYNSNFSSGFFSKLIQVYVINLEKVRAVNQN